MHLVPPVKREPTDEDIAVAKEWIIGERGMFRQMPWAGPRDCAHAVAFVLQPYGRPLIKDPTPLYLVEAPVAGTGKTLIVDCGRPSRWATRHRVASSPSRTTRSEGASPRPCFAVASSSSSTT